MHSDLVAESYESIYELHSALDCIQDLKRENAGVQRQLQVSRQIIQDLEKKLKQKALDDDDFRPRQPPTPVRLTQPRSSTQGTMTDQTVMTKSLQTDQVRLDNGKLLAEVKMLSSILAETDGKCTEMCEKHKTTQQTIATLDKSEAALKQKVSVLEIVNCRTDKELSDLRTKTERLTSEMAMVQSENSALQAANQSLSQQGSQLEQALHKMKGTADENENIRISQLKESQQSADDRERLARQACRDVTLRNEQLEAENKRLTAETENNQQRIMILEVDKEKILDVKERLAFEAESALSELEVLKKRYEEMRVELIKSKSANEKMRTSRQLCERNFSQRLRIVNEENLLLKEQAAQHIENHTKLHG